MFTSVCIIRDLIDFLPVQMLAMKMMMIVATIIFLTKDRTLALDQERFEFLSFLSSLFSSQASWCWRSCREDCKMDTGGECLSD